MKVGGFSPSLPRNYNDVDYCLKLRSAGSRIVFTPEVQLVALRIVESRLRPSRSRGEGAARRNVGGRHCSRTRTTTSTSSPGRLPLTLHRRRRSHPVRGRLPLVWPRLRHASSTRTRVRARTTSSRKSPRRGSSAAAISEVTPNSVDQSGDRGVGGDGWVSTADRRGPEPAGANGRTRAAARARDTTSVRRRASRWPSRMLTESARQTGGRSSASSSAPTSLGGTAMPAPAASIMSESASPEVLTTGSPAQR